MSLATGSSSIIVGCGYVGTHLAKELSNTNDSPLCIVRSKTQYDALSGQSLAARLFDLDQPPDEKFSLNTDNRNVYYFAPPSTTDLNDHRMVRFLQICERELPRRIVYISTSGVYGDCRGEWVDETAPIAPLTARAKRRMNAELNLQNFCQRTGTEYMILRVGGIYGAERLPIHRLAHITVICPQEAPFSNRIYISDLVHVCHEAMNCRSANEIINVADGHPTTMTDYYYQIADLAGLPRPPCVPMSQAKDKLSPGMLSFINESRRLSIDKLNRLFRKPLQFPTLKLGLQECFKNLNMNKL